MTRRENHVRRRPPSRQPRTRVLVVCGGARTEPDYFTGLKRRERNPAVHIKVIGKGVDPETLVRYAGEKRAHAPRRVRHCWVRLSGAVVSTGVPDLSRDKVGAVPGTR